MCICITSNVFYLMHIRNCYILWYIIMYSIHEYIIMYITCTLHVYVNIYHCLRFPKQQLILFCLSLNSMEIEESFTYSSATFFLHLLIRGRHACCPVWPRLMCPMLCRGHCMTVPGFVGPFPIDGEMWIVPGMLHSLPSFSHTSWCVCKKLLLGHRVSRVQPGTTRWRRGFRDALQGVDFQDWGAGWVSPKPREQLA